MNSPFTDFVKINSEDFVVPLTELELKAPFTEANYYVPDMEGELTALQLKTAVDLNRKYMTQYGWQDYSKQILKVIGINDDSWITNSREENLEAFTKFFTNWQERNGFKTSLPGVFGLNNWTYFQKKIGLNSLGNDFNIDVEKAIKANKFYAKNWESSKTYIWDYLNKGLPLNDEYFTYMIAKFQNEINPAFNNKIKVDGILGSTTWDILRTYIEKANPGFDIKQHVELNDAKTAAERYVEARLKYSSLMINTLEKIQSDIESNVRNKPIEFNTVRETIYAVANGIIGAVPLVGAAGNAMLDFNKEYWKNVEDNLNREFDKKRSLKLNDIIYILKNQTVERTSTIVIQHSLEDQLKYSGNIREKIFSDFTNEIERIMRLNQSPNEIMKLAISSLISAFSPHTRIYIHCRNTSDFRDWSDQDVTNLLQDTRRKRLNIRFTKVHPNVTIRENNLTPTEVENLKSLWELFKKYNYYLNDLKIKKDIFFNINIPLSISSIVISAKYNVEFSFYLKTLAPGERWNRLTTIQNLPYNVYRLPNNRFTYNDDSNSISRSLSDKNNKGLVYEEIILRIANSVMNNEYDLPTKSINLISNEAILEDDTISYEDHITAEFNKNSMGNSYFPITSENDFENENATKVSGYLSTDINLKRTLNNQSQIQKSGLQLVNIISALNKTVDIQAIRQALLKINQSTQSSQYKIDNSGAPIVDSVFTEAVHQFQTNYYLNPLDQDAVIGQSTIETLGFVDHGLRPKLSGSGLYGYSQLNRSDVNRHIPLLTNNEFTSANWFQYILKPAWLGVKISDGIHVLLYRKLKEAESWLLKQPQYKGLTPVELGRALGFNADTRYSGARLSASKQAMHGFGLALDINVSGNPWIGAGWIQNDKILLQERYRMIKALRNASGDPTLPGNTIFEYLHHVAQSNGNDTTAAYNTLKQRNDEFITYLKNNSAEHSYWKNSQTFAKRNPLNGFLNLHPDLVYALRHIAGLAWGAIDFGPRASGDIMHFDLRTLGVGKLICEKIGGFVPTNGHPSITQETFSDELMFEQMYDEEFTEEQPFKEANENTEWENFHYEEETKRSYSGSAQKPANIFLTLTSEKQGQIKGSVIQKGKEGTIAVYAFQHEITSPRDAASGMATGKRMHKPIVITKQVDLSSAKLLSVLVMNEKLKQVVINFWRPRTIGTTGSTGIEVNYYRVTLTNAFISNITQEKPITSEMNTNVIERVEFVYEKIEWQYLEGLNLTTANDWGRMNELEFNEAIEEEAASEEYEMMDEWEWEDWKDDELNNEEDEFEEPLMEMDEYSESETIEDNLIEEFVPKIALPDIRKRIDDYFDKANSEYKTDKSALAKARSQFRIANGDTISSEDAKTKVKKTLSGKSCGISSLLIHNAAYGRAKPTDIAKITQCLINAGELAKLRAQNTSLTDEQLIRLLQREFGIGIDCGGYVQLAFIFAYTGSDNDTSTVRNSLGLKERRGHENLGSLPAKHFEKIDKLNAQTGDLIIMNPRANDDGSIHTVIIVEHTKSGNVHKYLVDASWGFLYGDKASGISRRTFEFDTSTSEWTDIHPISGNKVFTNSIGPYKAHPIKGVYRARLKK